jgi:hypothetical protein
VPSSDVNEERRVPPTERTGPSFFGLFLTNPGLWPVILYLIGSMVGMLDSWWFYRRFGINVFLYSDIADFSARFFPRARSVDTRCVVLGLRPE